MPSLWNIFVTPDVRVVAADGQAVVVEVDGLLCRRL